MLKQILIVFGLAAFVTMNPAPESRIVGGGTVMLGIVPSMVSIRLNGTQQHFAGGSLISTLWVITGANYVIGRGQGELTLVMGIVNLASTGTFRQSAQIVVNPNYDRNTRQNDIALIRMVSAVVITTNIIPINLGGQIVADGEQANVSGWGATSEDKGPNSQQLMRLMVAVETCTHSDTDGSRVINMNSNLCARGRTSGSGICTSDVGGPLISFSGLIGIASWHRIPCGSNADVYIRISSFRNWITSVTGI